MWTEGKNDILIPGPKLHRIPKCWFYLAVGWIPPQINSWSVDHEIKVKTKKRNWKILLTLPQFINVQFPMLACSSLQRWVQIKLSEKGPTCPEGVATHTVPAMNRLHFMQRDYSGWQRPKTGSGQRDCREREKKGGQNDAKRRWGEEEKAGGQHANCPGPDRHILGRKTEGGGRSWGGQESLGPQDVLSHCQTQKCGWEIAGPRAVVHHVQTDMGTDRGNAQLEPPTCTK